MSTNTIAGMARRGSLASVTNTPRLRALTEARNDPLVTTASGALAFARTAGLPDRLGFTLATGSP